MTHRHFPVAACALLGALLALPGGPATSAPLPKDAAAFSLKFAGEVKIPDLMLAAAAFLGESRLVVVGSVANTEPEESIKYDPDKLDPNGAILDLTKKTHSLFTNGHKARIGTISVSGNRIATASNYKDPHVRVWDIKADKTVAAIKIGDPGEKTLRYGAACFHKGDRIAIAANKKVIVLDPAKPDERTEYDLPEEGLLWADDNLAVSHDDNWIACTAGKGQVACWNVATRKVTTLSLVPEKPKPDDQWMSKGVLFDPKGTLFSWRTESFGEVPVGKPEADIPADRRGVVRIDTTKDKAIPLTMGHTIYTLFCALDPTGVWLATCGNSRRDKPKDDDKNAGELRVYHLPTQTLVHREQLDESLPMRVAFSPSGKRLAAATADGVVRWWDVTAK